LDSSDEKDDDSVNKNIKVIQKVQNIRSEETEGMQFEDDIKTNSKPKLFVDNEDYYIENKENHRLDVDDKCELKRGFLYIVDDQKVIKKYESMLEN